MVHLIKADVQPTLWVLKQTSDSESEIFTAPVCWLGQVGYLSCLLQSAAPRPFSCRQMMASCTENMWRSSSYTGPPEWHCGYDRRWLGVGWAQGVENECVTGGKMVQWRPIPDNVIKIIRWQTWHSWLHAYFYEHYQQIAFASFICICKF